MAHPKRKEIHRWPAPARDASPAHRPSIKPVETTAPPAHVPVVEWRPEPHDEDVWPGNKVYAAVALSFGALTISAIAGLVSLWFLIPGIGGLILTGMVYVAAWSLEFDTPF